MMITSFCNLKGGVGKSLLVAHIASQLSQEQKVLVVDADFCVPTQLNALGSAEFEFQTDPLYPINENLKIWSSLTDPGSLSVKDLWKEAEIVLIDTPPAISSWVLNLVQQSDQVCLVSTPNPASTIGLVRTARLIRDSGFSKQFSILLNRTQNTDSSLLSHRLQSVLLRNLGLVSFGLGSVMQSEGLGKAWDRQVTSSKPIGNIALGAFSASQEPDAQGVHFLPNFKLQPSEAA